MASFTERIIRAALLNADVYEEVEADKGAMGQAIGIVVLSSVAAGIGSGIKGGLRGILIGTVAALVAWYIWAFLTYFIGTKLLPEPQTRADVGELLRTIGFSSSPGLIRILGVIPGIGGYIFPIASIWMLIAMVIAVQHALDYKNIFRAIGVCVIGFIVQVVVLVLLYFLLGGFPKPV